MASMEVTFFATIDEIAAFVRGWLRVEAVSAVAVEFWPFLVVPTTSEQVEDHVRRVAVHELVFSEKEIDVAATDQLEFLQRNPGVLILEIGRLGASCLEESRVSTLDATASWRRIANDIRKHTAAGMVGVNEQTGATATYRTARYTEGAARLERSGAPLRQHAQIGVRFSPRS